jgi:polysaccharide export outer membrane protein
LTLREVEHALKERLADGFFRNPQVSAAIEQYRSQRIFVVGEVRQPGTYPLTGDMTLIEALARAGSTTATAGGEVVIVRQPAGARTESPLLPNQANGSEVRRVDIKELQNGSLSANLALRDGDTIFLPRAEAVYVFGQVKNPGAYVIQKDTTVLQALSLAGGVTERGSTSRIKVVRLLNGKKVESKIKLNDIVHPGDTVLVSERFF